MRILISYRRADSEYVFDRIRDRSISASGVEAGLRDDERIPLGQNFSDVLEEAISISDARLAYS